MEGEDHLHCCCYKSLDFGDDGSGKQTMDYQGFRLCTVVIYGVGLLSPKLYADVPAGPGKFDFLYTNFFAQLPTHECTIFKRKAPKFAQIGCFLQ